MLSSGLGGSLSGKNNRRSMDSRVKEKPYKYTGAKVSQIGYFNIYSEAPRSKFKSLTNRQYCGSVIYSQNRGTHNKVLSDISKEIWDYLLLERITITVQYLPWVLNQEDDIHSRSMKDTSEWKLKP